MMDQPAGRPPALDGHEQGVAGEPGAAMIGHAPADLLTRLPDMGPDGRRICSTLVQGEDRCEVPPLAWTGA